MPLIFFAFAFIFFTPLYFRRVIITMPLFRFSPSVFRYYADFFDYYAISLRA